MSLERLVLAASDARDRERPLVSAARAGDREAFSELVRRYEREVYRLCYRYTNHHHDAADLAQDAFFKAYRAIGGFRGDSRFSTWLYRIAVNTCLNFKALRRPPLEPLWESLPARPGRELERLDGRERSRRLRAAVARLPQKQRATLILKIYQELTHEEVAQVMGSTVGTVKANLFHALRNLRRLAQEEGVEAP